MKLAQLTKSATPTKKPLKDSTALRIDAYLQEQYNKPLNYTPVPSHSPSTFGTKCLRKIYYSYWKVEKDIPTDAKSAKIFETGKHYENMVMSWLKGIGEHIPYVGKDGKIPLDRHTGEPNPQFPIAVPEWRIKKGFIDNVGVCGGELWLYEIKSSNSFKFDQLQEPMSEHKIQTAAYYRAFETALHRGDYAHIEALKGFENFLGCAGVKLIYVNKDTSEIKIFALDRKDLEANIAEVQAKVVLVDTYIASKELPPKTEDKCSWCPFKKKCKKDVNISF
jgi:hypothetical protein